jgi:hypothetical protein
MKKWYETIQRSAFFRNEPITLVDVGASGCPPLLWCSISALACYLGFDPDQRDRREDNFLGFRRFIMLDKAVSERDAAEANFYLTVSPHCSSMLKPNLRNLAHYSFSDHYLVERRATVPVIRLDAAVREAGLSRIDWLKLDSQGKDLDIYLSLDDSMRTRLLALDVEPGVIDFYEGENTFAEAHARLTKDGFWLSRINLQQYPRVAKTTRERLISHAIDFSLLSGSPTAIEARYLRTLEFLASTDRELRDYVCLWLFSMLDGQLGFALDVALQMPKEHNGDELAALLLGQTLAETQRYCRSKSRSPRAIAKKLLPRSLYPLARRVSAWMR